MIKYQCAHCSSTCQERILPSNPPKQEIICPKCGIVEHSTEKQITVMVGKKKIQELCAYLGVNDIVIIHCECGEEALENGLHGAIVHTRECRSWYLRQRLKDCYN